MRKLAQYSLLLIITYSLCLNVWARDEIEEELMSLSFEQLLELEVSVASTQSENILNTPAIVSRIDVAALRQMGVHDLSDIIAMLPGANVQHAAIGTRSIMLRGIFEAFNQKVLFQLDGVPYWQPGHGDIPIAGIPLEAISHIEVIRGPGTVFHGSNASAGVINIITKKSGDAALNVAVTSNEGKEVAGYTSFDVGSGTLDVSMHWREQGRYEAFYNNRPVPPFFPVPPPSQGVIEKEPQDHSVMLKWQNDKVLFQYHEFRSELQGVAAAAAITNVSEMRQEGRLLRGEIDWKTGIGEFTTYADYNNYFLSIPTENLFGGAEDGTQNFGSGSNNSRLRFGTQYFRQWDNQTQVVAGLEVEEREIGDYRNSDGLNHTRIITMPADETTEWSAYAQWLRDFQDLRVAVGFRYVDNEKSGTNLLPRVSIIKTFSKNASLKAIYSSGFNSPNFVQQSIDIPPNVIQGNPDLEAEVIESLDIAYTFTKDNHLFIANLYWLHADDFIQRVSDEFRVQYQNTDHFNRYGLELDYQFATDSYRIHSNVAYQHNANKPSDDDIGRHFVPKLSGNFGAHWKLSEQHQIGASYRFVGSRAAADSNHFLNLQYQYLQPSHEIYVVVENILGDDYQMADIQDFNAARIITGGDEDPVVRLGTRVSF